MSGIENTISEKLQDASWVQVDEAALWTGIEAQMAPSGKRGIFWILGACGLLLATLTVAVLWQDAPIADEMNFHNPELLDHSARQVVSPLVFAESNSPVPAANVESAIDVSGSKAKAAPSGSDASQLPDDESQNIEDRNDPGNVIVIPQNSGSESNLTHNLRTTEITDAAQQASRDSDKPMQSPTRRIELEMASVELNPSPRLMPRIDGFIPMEESTTAQPGLKQSAEITKIPSTSSLFDLDVFAGPNRSFVSYKSGDGNLEELKNSTEDGEWGVSLGVMARREMSNGLFVGAGVEHNKLWTRFEYRSETTSSGITENHPVQIIIDGSSGDTLEVIYGDAPTTFYHSRHVRHYAEFNMISIPVVVGKSIQSNKLNLSVAGGPLINLSYKSTGRSIAAGEQLSTYEEQADLAPIKGLTFGARLQARAAYELSDRWTAHLSPTYTMSWRSVSDDLTARLSWLTINAGVGFEF